MADPPYSSTDFHQDVQKQMVAAIQAAFAESKLDWKLISPVLDAARDMCRADFAQADIRIHATHREGDSWAEAEEAFLGISVRDRDDGEAWLTETRWLSELALAGKDPERVRAAVAGLRRSIAKLEAWLARRKAGGPPEPEPPAE